MTLNSGDGNDTVAVGSEAGFWPTLGGLTNFKGDANEIRAQLTIDGGAGSDTRHRRRHAATARRTSASSRRPSSSASSAPAATSTYSDLESLTIDLGNAVTDSQGTRSSSATRSSSTARTARRA